MLTSYMCLFFLFFFRKQTILYHKLINLIIKHIKHKQNLWGSENVVLYELNKVNYKLYNPCIQIKIIHEHESEIRNVDRKRINMGDINGDGIFSIRSCCVKPCYVKL